MNLKYGLHEQYFSVRKWWKIIFKHNSEKNILIICILTIPVRRMFLNDNLRNSFRNNDFDYHFDDNPSPGDYGGATPNPGTPGYSADTPSPMGPFTPQTPGTSYSPYAQPSPSPGSYSGIKAIEWITNQMSLFCCDLFDQWTYTLYILRYSLILYTYLQHQVQVLVVLHQVLWVTSPPHLIPHPHPWATVQWLLGVLPSPQGQEWTKAWQTGTQQRLRSRSEKRTMTTNSYIRRA